MEIAALNELSSQINIFNFKEHVKKIHIINSE